MLGPVKNVLPGMKPIFYVGSSGQIVFKEAPNVRVSKQALWFKKARNWELQ